MKVPKKTQTREANLSFEELELLAEDIRMIITQGNSYTLREYIRIVESIDINELGYRKARALLFEPKLESYFPDSVFTALKLKGREARNHKFNEEDDIFMEKNIRKGLEWMADRFYTTKEEIYERIVALDLVNELV